MIGILFIVRNYIGNYYIECFFVFVMQDMWIVYIIGRIDDFGINDRFVVIQCLIGIFVCIYCIVYGFFVDVVICKIGKEISYVIFFGYIVLIIGRLLCFCQLGYKIS